MQGLLSSFTRKLGALPRQLGLAQWRSSLGALALRNGNLMGSPLSNIRRRGGSSMVKDEAA
jgi:hypothetical protein